MTRKSPIVTLSLAAVFGATGLIAHAGDLDPPAGPITPTMKTLDEVEPRIAINSENTPGDADSLFKITQPGSYYLTGNIAGVAGKHGIEIASSGVTLDLKGFDLVGVAGAFDGVSVTVAGLTNIAVLNGSLRSWGDEGIDMETVAATNCRVEGVLASGNTGIGISTGVACTISNCSASANTGYGIFASSRSTVSNCSASSNTSIGIGTGTACTVSNCSAFSNAVSGISTGSGCTVTNCSASQNTVNGISVSSGSTVADCTARNNTLDGILCSLSCVIRGNTCMINGNAADGAGIHATGDDNRIEGNNCTLADRGIDVDAAGNIIVRNTCSGNTLNWDVVAGNVILVVNATTAGAVSGNSGGTAPGSTDPSVNFTY